MLRNISLCVGATSFLLAGAAHAVDVDSADFIAADPGTNAMLSYTTFAKRSTYTANGGAKIDKNTSLDSVTEILRFVHYTEIGGLTVAPQVLLPYAKLYNGKVGGNSLGSTSRFGDPIIAFPTWFINTTSTKFAIVPYLFIPVGSYDGDKSLNVGENRWKFDLEVALTRSIGDDFSVQTTLDVTVRPAPSADSPPNWPR